LRSGAAAREGRAKKIVTRTNKPKFIAYRHEKQGLLLLIIVLIGRRVTLKDYIRV
jgi:hypothetical protein